jgi:sugar/nucleoside kinase (ribokinase family)
MGAQHGLLTLGARGAGLALARGEALPAAARQACAVAALATTRPGAQPALPAEAEVLQLRML